MFARVSKTSLFSLHSFLQTYARFGTDYRCARWKKGLRDVSVQSTDTVLGGVRCIPVAKLKLSGRLRGPNRCRRPRANFLIPLTNLEVSSIPADAII